MGAKRGFSLSVAWWSVASMLHAFGSGVASFSVFRFLLGTGEAANFPAALKAIAEWFKEDERSTAVGIVTAGTGLGAIIAPPAVAWITLTAGWRAAFVFTGAIGFLWLIFWWRLYQSPAPAGPMSASPAPVGRRSRRELLRHRQVWGLMLSRCVSDGAFYFFVFWLPAYLASERGFNLAEIGLFAWIPFAAADAGSVAGGWIGSRLIKSGVSLHASRMATMWVGAVLCVAAWPAIGAGSASVAIALIALAMFAIQFKQSSLFTLPADLYPPSDVATVWGLAGAAGSFGGMAFTPLVGWLVQHVSYAPVFGLVSAMHLVSVAVVALMIPRIEAATSRLE
jgi:ACS family hexuronate transporter-like MFS transporter